MANPLNVKSELDTVAQSAINAMVCASEIASESGISDMSLEEINTEIEEARKCISF